MSGSSAAMGAEFDIVAGWTADVAAGLEPAYRIPAGCRGSGSPGAMRWLLGRLEPERGEVFLDCGAGVGGPAAFAARETGVRPVLTDPQAGACRAARTLFGLPALRAGTELPLASGLIGSGWSLGVVCTVDDQPTFLAEVRRVLHPEGRFGLLVYCADHPGDLQLRPPEGNSFPTVPALDGLLEQAGLRVLTSGWTEDFTALPGEWEAAMATVQEELERRGAVAADGCSARGRRGPRPTACGGGRRALWDPGTSRGASRRCGRRVDARLGDPASASSTPRSTLRSRVRLMASDKHPC